jgi:hypothetical protein
MENASNFIYVNKTDIFHQDGDIYELYDEPREMCVSSFITMPTTPSSAFVASLPASIT